MKLSTSLAFAVCGALLIVSNRDVRADEVKTLVNCHDARNLTEGGYRVLIETGGNESSGSFAKVTEVNSSGPKELLSNLPVEKQQIASTIFWRGSDFQLKIESKWVTSDGFLADLNMSGLPTPNHTVHLHCMVYQF